MYFIINTTYHILLDKNKISDYNLSSPWDPDSIFNAELYTFENMIFFVIYLTRKKEQETFCTKNLTASHILITTLTFNRFYIRHTYIIELKL